MRDLKDRLDLCSINTATLGHQAEIRAMTDAIAGAGYGFICPWRRDVEGENVQAVSRHIKDAGLKLSGYCRSTYFPAATRAEFKAGLEDNRRALDDAATLDAPCFVLVVGSLPAGSRDIGMAREQSIEGVSRLLEHARDAGVKLALEPLHPMYANDRSCLNTMEQALDWAEAIEPAPGAEPDIGVAVDLYHVWWDPKLEEEIARAGAQERIFGLHVCDWLVPTRDLLTDRGMMGDGVIDIAKIRGLVEAAGYDGSVEVEIFSAEDWWRRPMEDTLAVCAERLQSIC